MAGRPRESIDVLQGKGKKHLTKKEIAERTESEVRPVTDNISPPDYLTAKQKKVFEKIAGQLLKLKVMGETDCNCLARYVIAIDLYVSYVKKLRSKEAKDDPALMQTYVKLHDTYAKQLEKLEEDLGLNPRSRPKLAASKPAIEVKVNKFSKFEKAEGDK